jgi:hypothetical protein
MKLWHGGPRIIGDKVRPPIETGFARVTHGERWVYITPERGLALNYAATCNGWLYEVEPIGPVEQDPDSILAPGDSLRCERARIIRRFKPSRAEVEERRWLVEAIAQQWDRYPSVTDEP